MIATSRRRSHEKGTEFEESKKIAPTNSADGFAAIRPKACLNCVYLFQRGGRIWLVSASLCILYWKSYEVNMNVPPPPLWYL